MDHSPASKENRDHHQSDQYRQRRSIFFPLLLVTIGIVLYLNNIGYIKGNTWDVLFRLWPLLFILGGLNNLINLEGYVTPILSISAGSLLLLWNLGYLDFSGIEVWNLIHLWPILLVAWGLDLIVGRRSFFAAFIGIILGIALVTGTLWLVLNPIHSIPPGTQKIEQKLEKGITEGQLNILVPTGKFTLSGSANSAYFLQGDIPPFPSGTLDNSYKNRGELGIFTIDNFNNPGFWKSNLVPEWTFKLNSELPMSIRTSMAVGDITLNLTKLNVEKFDVESAIGSVRIVLPAHGNIQGKIDMAVGETILQIPRDTAVRIELDTAVTAVTYPPTYQQIGDIISSPSLHRSEDKIYIKIDIPFGNINIRQMP